MKEISTADLDRYIAELCVYSEVGVFAETRDEDKPWEKKRRVEPLNLTDFFASVTIIKANMLYIDKHGISQRALNRIKRLGAFRNPEFYRAQAMRLPVFNKPRIIDTSVENEQYLMIPRGCLSDLCELIKDAMPKGDGADMRNGRRFLLPLGMAAALVYTGMVLLGQALSPDLDAVRNFISYLTADGATNKRLMQSMNNISGLLLVLFAMGVNQTASSYCPPAHAGYRLLLAMSATMFIGYALLPLRAYEHFWSPHNMAHFVMSVILISAAVVAALLIGIGHLRDGRLKRLGIFSVCSATAIALFGGLTLMSMSALQRYMGLLQRLMVFSMEGWIFGLSLVHTVANRRTA